MVGKMKPGSEEAGQARLLRALRSGPNDAACQDCLDQLDEYVAAQLAGEDYRARFPEVAVHLDACPDCAEAYARLYELELAEAANRLPQPDQLPAPDLSFLARESAATSASTGRAAADLAERLRTALRRTGATIRLQLSADLVSWLTPAPAATLTRAPADTERYNEALLNLEPAQAPALDLPLTLTAYRDAHHPERCLVEVVVEPAGRSWPDLGGAAVALAFPGERREAVTDAWGAASFEGVPVNELAEMALEVTLAG